MYDVFLSFRGPDTRSGFLSHLYDALLRNGNTVFKDDKKLESGKPISSELLKAIEESRSAIVIFSENYASSRSCLEELAHIIKCKKILIPIFYDVSPSDVSHQNPPFAESFSKHEKKYKDDLEKVQRWRDACAEAAEQKGYHLQNDKDEADCIKKLVDDISTKFLQVISPFSESLVGMESRIEEVISLLDLESNDVHAIGIWGMGGIGKTEIAYGIHMKCCRDFMACCFLGNVGENYQKNGLTWLQETLIYMLLGIKMTITSELQGATFISSKLCQMKVLIILDDVNHLNQINFLVGGLEWFGTGSRILITSRDKHLILTHVKKDKVYEVQLLSKTEALELFCMKAFKKKSPERDFEKLSSEMVKYADGLPLALKVLGSSISGRNKEQCRDIIDRLKKIPNDNILEKLRTGLYGLDKDEMRIFLDIGSLYNHEPRYNVERILKSCGIFMIGITRLIEKSLLSISRDGYSFQMHNLISQMGQNVLREKYANSRIWLHEEVHDLFAGKLKPKKVESLSIPQGYRFEDDHVNHSKVFKRMKSLQVLILGRETICSDSAITCLPSSLRWIEWPNYPSSSLPEKYDPSYLVGLCLYSSQLVKLWSKPKKLNNLKHLDLSWSSGLAKTPKFSDMPNLETLILEGCENLEEVHSSLGHCRMLTKLGLRGCGKLKKLPELKLSDLKHFDLSWSSGLTKTPNFGDMPNLETLILEGCENLEEVHPSLGHCRMLTKLNLKYCDKLKKLPELKLGNLKCLYLSRCNGLTEIPNLSDKPNLELLILDGCENLEEVHPSLGHCRMLKELNFMGCGKLKKLPELKWGNLKLLNLSQCGGLTETPNLGDNPILDALMLHGCENLEEIHPSIGHCRMLTYLDLDECHKLKKLPELKLSKLGSLNLKGCWNLEEVHPSLGHCTMLKQLNFLDCHKLKKLPKFVTMESLTILDLDCTSLEEFPEIHGDMQRLTKLMIKSTRIRELPSSIGNLSGLTELDLAGCEDLVSLPSNLCNLKNLQCLFLHGCKKLEKLPEINGDMHSLTRLIIKSTGIRELPSSIGNLSGLTKFKLEGCEDLVSLPDTLCNLKNLLFLFLHGCKKLEKLPENIGDLQELNTLDARETAISQLPPSITKLGKLSNLNILRGLPEDLGSLQSLKSLDVSGSNIYCFPKSIKELLGLETLDVQFCQNLNELPEQLPPNLEELCADYHLALKSIRDLLNKCLKLRRLSISWCGHEKFEYGTVSSEQVNVLKLLQHFRRTCIQCDFYQRDYFLISFPEVKIPELFDYQFINQKELSIELNPSWYTDEFMGFSICFRLDFECLALTAKLVCKSDTERKHSLYYSIFRYCHVFPVCFIYIPFKTLWHGSDNNKDGKNPNDYYLFEVASRMRQLTYYGIRLEYENKDSAVTPEIGCSMVLEQSEPSHTSGHLQASADHNIVTDRGLHLGNANKDVEVDQEAMAVQKKHESQNVEQTRVCDSPSRKMDDALRKIKRKRKRNRNKKRKIVGTDETSFSHFTNKYA